MSAITAKSPHDSSFSFSRRYFHWKNNADDGEDDNISNTTTATSSSWHSTDKHRQVPKKPHHSSISRLKSALSFTFLAKTRSLYHHSTPPVIGTLFGRRRGHVSLAFQSNPKSSPCFLIELATPTSVLIREMASGLVRIALECEKTAAAAEVELLEEPRWRAYCNGRKCGYANNKREFCDEECKVLKAVEPITMGAGVLPAGAWSGKGNEAGGSECDGELMYMRAKFERVVGSKDSEAFYMMNPDHYHRNNNAGPELSIYLLRV